VSNGAVRIISCNVNGIRSATEKGFVDWVRRQRPDVVCLQEVRAHAEQMPRRARAPRGYHVEYRAPERRGYSGVGIWSRTPPIRVDDRIGAREWDDQGRFVGVDLDGVLVCSLYMPSGSSGPERQEQKYRFMEAWFQKLKRLGQSGCEVIVCGDWNIAHKEIDLKNWRSNRKNSGFLPEERAWLDRVIDDLGYVDVFRRLDTRAEQYTWWSNRGRAWEKNVGWRLDYQLATPGVAAEAEQVSVYRRRRFSDHAPVIIDYRRARPSAVDG